MAPYYRQIVQSVIASTLITLVLGGTPARGQRPTPHEEPGTPVPLLTLGMVEGIVTAVDSTSGTFEISLTLFGLSAKTLAVTPHTRIQVEGRQTEATEIREGDMVKAAYEVREGQNVAAFIDLIPSPGSQQATTPGAEKEHRETIPTSE